MNQSRLEIKDWMKDKEFTLVSSMSQLEEIVDHAIEAGKCALDLETTGLDNRIDNNGKTVDDIVGYCLSCDGEEGIYVPVNHKSVPGPFEAVTQGKGEEKPHEENLDYRKVSEEIKRLCENCVTIYHNSKFDLEFLYGSYANIEIEDPSMFEDTLILSYLRDPTQKRHGLKRLSKEDLGMEMIEFSDLGSSFEKLEPSWKYTVYYAGSDAICTYLLYEALKDYGKESKENLYKIEKGAVISHRWMERNRPKLDKEYLERLRDQIDEKIQGIKDEIYTELSSVLEFPKARVEKEFDIDSPQKLGKALKKMKEEKRGFNVELKKTDTGQVSTNEEAIEELSEKHGEKFPFLKKIGTFRNLRKVNSTYVKPLLEGGDWDGQIKDHTARFKFNAYGTDSGRFSAKKGRTEYGYSGVNVQSMPGCYNAAEFPVKKVHSRPDKEGEEDAELFEDYLYARNEQGLVRNEYDNHFIEDLRSGNEYCLRKSCEDCPFLENCNHDEPEEKRFLSLGAAVRPAVVPRDEYVIAAIDFSGVEMRVAAELSDEENWKEEFIHGEGDGHKQTAKIIYGDDVVNKPDFKMYRQNAKAANFAVLYGGGGGAIANSAGISEDEGWEILEKMMEGIPSFRKWKNNVIERAKKDGYVETCLNRRIPLPKIYSEEKRIRKAMERKAVNSIIQGSATGDLIKYSMWAVHNELRKKGMEEEARLLFAIHDELVFEVKKDKLEKLVPIIREKMTEFGDKMGWDIPVEVEVELGEVWDTPHEWGKFKRVEENMGLAKKSVPEFLRSYVEFKKGMWIEREEDKRYIYDGDEFINSNSDQYNWGLCHEPQENRPLMKKPIRKDWIDHIQLYSGMFWKEVDEYGLYDGEEFHQDYETYLDSVNEEEIEIESSSEFESTNSSEEEAEKEKVEEEKVEEESEEDQQEEGKEKETGETGLPVFTYKSRSNINKSNSEYYVIKLKSVIKFLETFSRKHNVEKTHELDVKSPRGRSILPEGKTVCVDPDLFLLLAEYEGL